MRLDPQMPPGAYQTFQVAAPLSTHWRPATCAEVDCPEYTHGWRLRVEALSEQDVHVATHCGRKYRKVAVTAGETWLIFEAGQPCFRATQHRLPRDASERFFERGGDWRGQTSPLINHSAAGWVDSFGEHQDRLKEAQERG